LNTTTVQLGLLLVLTPLSLLWLQAAEAEQEYPMIGAQAVVEQADF
jgi:hypothetical protein